MSKPTLFFSHSSQDKDMVLAIKNKVMKYTSGTLEIFQSSDGESIPFGTNWIHKVEEGLKEARVMHQEIYLLLIQEIELVKNLLFETQKLLNINPSKAKLRYYRFLRWIQLPNTIN